MEIKILANRRLSELGFKQLDPERWQNKIGISVLKKVIIIRSNLQETRKTLFVWQKEKFDQSSLKSRPIYLFGTDAQTSSHILFKYLFTARPIGEFY